jgi:predicted acyl esterase
MTDGARLAAKLWLPEPVVAGVPAILEHGPYRKNDATAAGDEQMYGYFAAHGYACVRVDMRGCGDSDGILAGEYLAQEQDDALEVLAWIAAQPWSDGQVGMIGISWTGFNALQVAFRRPPQLKAVISMCSTDDRYRDDIHYMGGCVLGVDMLSWATTMLGYNARPPHPAVAGDAWREIWQGRIRETPAFVEEWLAHQRRDAFWKHGSICESYNSLECPLLMVGGWADAYRNAILRILAHYEGPCRGLIGPWSHHIPFDAQPGPSIGFLQECLRWWDHWLKHEQTGIMDEPVLRAWMQDSVPPHATGGIRPGRWVGEGGWPPSGREPSILWLAPGVLGHERSPADEACSIAGTLLTGHDGGDWLGFGRAIDAPADQRGEDGRSLSFDGEPVIQFQEPAWAPNIEVVSSSPAPSRRTIVRDLATGRLTITTDFSYFGRQTYRDGFEYSEDMRDAESIVSGDPLSAEVRCERTLRLRQGEWRVRVEAWASMSSTAEEFLVTNGIDAYEGEARVSARRWSRRIPRDLV